MELSGTDGEVQWRYDYDAFGNERSIAGQDSSQDTNPFRYCGEYYDTETGKLYLRARYYDPTIGRFMSEDSIRARHMNLYDPYGNYQDVFLMGGVYSDWMEYIVQDPLSLNLYVYCQNNPIRYIDSSGNMAAEATILATNWWNPAGWVAGGILLVEVVFVVAGTFQVADALADAADSKNA